MKWVVCGLAAGLGVSATAGAASVTGLDLDDLAARADRIVTGEVVELSARWVDGVIVTDVAIAVEECLKGPCERARVEVRVLGGRVDDLEMQAEGMARFELDERVLLFLESAGPSPGPWRPVGLAQGKFRVVEGAGEPMALRDVEGLRLVGPRAHGAQGLSMVEMRALVARVHAALEP